MFQGPTPVRRIGAVVTPPERKPVWPWNRLESSGLQHTGRGDMLQNAMALTEVGAGGPDAGTPTGTPENAGEGGDKRAGGPSGFCEKFDLSQRTLSKRPYAVHQR